MYRIDLRQRLKIYNDRYYILQFEDDTIKVLTGQEYKYNQAQPHNRYEFTKEEIRQLYLELGRFNSLAELYPNKEYFKDLFNRFYTWNFSDNRYCRFHYELEELIRKYNQITLRYLKEFISENVDYYYDNVIREVLILIGSMEDPETYQIRLEFLHYYLDDYYNYLDDCYNINALTLDFVEGLLTGISKMNDLSSKPLLEKLLKNKKWQKFKDDIREIIKQYE